MKSSKLLLPLIVTACINAPLIAYASTPPVQNATEKNTPALDNKPRDQDISVETKTNKTNDAIKVVPAPVEATPIDISKPCPLFCGAGESKERNGRS